MSGYILCQTKKAQNPYFIENISVNIYSIEELCYYLYHNLYLVDQTIMNEELCTWIAEELDLAKLAMKLRAKTDSSNIEDFLYPIFKEINYLAYEELRAFHNKIARLNKESELLRQKRKGDSLVENGMYVNAIRVYQQILDRKGLQKEREGFWADVLYNLGCAYTYLFQMEKAMECFWAAYQEKNSPKLLKAYLLAYRNIRNKTDYEHRIAELKIDEELKTELKETLRAFEKISEKTVDDKELEGILEKLTKEYHRTTGS